MTDALTPEIKFQLVRKIENHKVLALTGKTLLVHEKKYLEFHKPAGVILFERNVSNLSQLGDLITAVTEALADGGFDPLIMTDHEGDLVSSLKNIIGVPPSPLALASAGDPAFVLDVARATGAMMRKLGINTVLGPSADCCFDLCSPVTGLRTFGADPGSVGEYVSQMIRGYHEAGLIVCVKHFPGHGSTAQDSHTALPVVNKSMAELKAEDLVPFAGAFEAGAEMCMMSHIAFDIGRENSGTCPASFDKYIIGEVLRKDMAFGGVVITDALEMAGAREHARGTYGGLTGGLERPLLAGADILLLSEPLPERLTVGENGDSVMSLNVMETIIKTLDRVVDKSRIEKKLKDAADKIEGLGSMLDLLETSAKRINRLRRRATHCAPPPREPDRGKVIDLSNYPARPGIYMTAAERSIALVRDPDCFVPAAMGASNVLMPVVCDPGGPIGSQDLNAFIDMLLRHFESWQRTGIAVDFVIDPSGTPRPVFAESRRKGVHEVLEDVPDDADAVIPVFSSRGSPPAEFLDSFAEFAESKMSPLVIVTGWPLIEWIPKTIGVMVTFGSGPEAASAAAGVMSGKIEARGRVSHIWRKGGR